MKTVLKDDFVDGLLDQGRLEGRAEGEARIVLRILTARGLPVTTQVRDRVMKCADTDQLEAWADRAATATSIEEIFGDGSASA